MAHYCKRTPARHQYWTKSPISTMDILTQEKEKKTALPSLLPLLATLPAAILMIILGVIEISEIYQSFHSRTIMCLISYQALIYESKPHSEVKKKNFLSKQA